MVWRNEKHTHSIIFMSGVRLLCTCGQEFQVRRKDSGLSKNVRHNILLDLHALHKKLEGNK